MKKTIASGSVALLVSLVFLFSNASVAQRLRTGNDVMPRSQFVPFYTTKNFHVMAMLNNTTGDPTTVNPILFTMQGQSIPMPSVQLAAHQTASIDINAFVENLGDDFSSGSMRFDFIGKLSGVNVIAMMVNDIESVEIDVLGRPVQIFKSSSLETIWWAPDEHSKVGFAVQNTTGTPKSITINVTGSDGTILTNRDFVLDQHQAREFNLSEFTKGDKSTVGGISIRHNGSPGSVMAHGFVLDRKRGFSANLTFSDPATAGDTKMDGAGIILNANAHVPMTGHLLLRNRSDVNTHVTARLQWGPIINTIARLDLLPGEAREVIVPSGTIQSYDQAIGVSVEHAGANGDVTSVWFSTNGTGNLVVETPLKSHNRSSVRGGNHPWDITGNQESVLYVKNTGYDKSTLVAQIWYDQGKYLIGLKEVAPGETYSLDFRKLRDEQIADQLGRTIPLNVMTGQVQWNWRSGPQLVGRVQVTNVDAGLSNNMSCPACGCMCDATGGDSYGLSVSPGGISTYIGAAPYTPSLTETDLICGASTSYSVTADYWDTSNYSVASVVSDAINFTGAGSAILTAYKSVDEVYATEPGLDGGCPDCYDDYETLSVDFDVSVVPTISGPSSVWWFSGLTPSGYSTSVTLTSSGGSGTTWSVPTGSDKVTLSSTSGAQITVSSSGSNWSMTEGDIKIVATSNGVASPQFSFSTLLPYQLSPNSLFTFHDCINGNIPEDYIAYNVADNLGHSLTTPIGVNEAFPSGKSNDYTGSDWPLGAPGGSTTSSSQPSLMQDRIHTASNVTMPTPICNSSDTPSNYATLTIHMFQVWRFGSDSPGYGVQVQTDNIQEYRNGSRHTSITTPILSIH